jgi:hypothetical protein
MRVASSIVVLTMGLVLAASASGSTGQTRLLGSTGAHFRQVWQVRPTRIVYTGDGSGILDRLRWATWSPSRAVGSGTVELNDCNPSCAGGTFTAHAVRVIAFRPVRGRFTRLTLRYAYRGKRRVQRWGIRRIGGAWSYYLAVGHPQ